MEEITTTSQEENPTPTCGLVMPISAIDGMSSEHWLEVRSILEQVATDAGFSTKLVSSATVSGLLPARIVTNLYTNDIVICDVSGRNPNVMFELGLRLAFDKPTIIIKDDATEYTFDIQSIGHLDYPRSLRITKMELFKSELKKTLNETHQRNIDDPTYSTFLKHYQIFEAKGLETTSDFQAFVKDGFDTLSKEISYLRDGQKQPPAPVLGVNQDYQYRQHMKGLMNNNPTNFLKVIIKKAIEVNKILTFPDGPDELTDRIKKELRSYRFHVADDTLKKFIEELNI